MIFLLFETEDEIDSRNEAEGCNNMIPLDLHVECNHRKDDKDDHGDDLLHDFELHERERSTVALKANTIGWDLETVLEECNAPRYGNKTYHR